jgi:hypothetical protein
MDKIDSLIKTLTEFKEELEKASKDPALAPKEVKIKELQGKIDAGTYKPDASKIADKMLKKGPNEASVAAPAANGTPDMAKGDVIDIKKKPKAKIKDLPKWHDDAKAPKEQDPAHPVDSELHPSTIKPENLKRLIKEELMCSENGQWNIKVKS